MSSTHSFFQRNIVRAIIASGLVWFFITLVPNSLLVPFRSLLAPVAAPFQGFFSWVAFETRDTFRFLTSVSDLKQENDYLLRENQRLRHEVALSLELKEENRILREISGLPKIGSGTLLLAEVISRDRKENTFSFTLNRGSTDGVQPGLPVVVGSGQLVGRIATAELTSSRVHLLSHPESTIAARIAGTSIQGVVRGDHGLGLIFDMALSGERLEPGVALVTSGLGDDLPKGLYIGTIGEVRPSADRLFQQATIVTGSVESDIRFASIILSPV